MNRLLPVVAASALLAAVPSFFIGYWLAQSTAPEIAAPTAVVGQSSGQTVNRGSPAFEDFPEIRGAGEELNRLAAAEGIDNGSALDYEIQRLVGRTLSSPDHDERLLPHLRSLGRVDPDAAIRYALQVPGARAQREALSAALSGWGESDGASALAWLAEAAGNLSNVERNERLTAILAGYALTAPTDSIRYAASLSENTSAERRLKRSAVESVQSVLVSQGNVSLAILGLEQISGGSLRQELQNSLVRDWAALDPHAAALYVNELGDDAPTRLQSELIRSWAGIAPEEAALYLSDLGTDHPEFGRATASLVMQWTEFDISSPGEWLNSLPASNEVDRAVAVYTARAAREDPEGAMSWATSIQNERLRSRMMDRVASEWNASDPGAFQDFVNEVELPDEQRERLLNSAQREPRTGGGRGWGGWGGGW